MVSANERLHRGGLAVRLTYPELQLFLKHAVCVWSTVSSSMFVQTMRPSCCVDDPWYVCVGVGGRFARTSARR